MTARRPCNACKSMLTRDPKGWVHEMTGSAACPSHGPETFAAIEVLAEVIEKSLKGTELGTWLQVYKLNDVAQQVAVAVYRHTSVEMERLREMSERCGICRRRGLKIVSYGPHPVASQRNEYGSQGDWSPVAWCEECSDNQSKVPT